MLAKVRFAVPLFASLTGIGAVVVPTGCEPNVTLAGVSVIAVPLPLSRTICGLVGSLSLMIRLPKKPFHAVTEVAVVGVNITLKVHFAPAATLPAQLLVWEKPPIVFTLEIVRGVVPTFVRVTSCGAEVVPKARSRKIKPG
jgi:hypothetical protein